MTIASREMAQTGRLLDVLSDPDKFKERLGQLQAEMQAVEDAREEVSKREAEAKAKEARANEVLVNQAATEKRLAQLEDKLKSELETARQDKVDANNASDNFRRLAEQTSTLRNQLELKQKELTERETILVQREEYLRNKVVMAENAEAAYKTKLSALKRIVNTD